MIDSFLTGWWPQICAAVFLVAWANRSLSNMEVRIQQLEKKVENLFQLWNRHIDRLLDKG